MLQQITFRHSVCLRSQAARSIRLYASQTALASQDSNRQNNQDTHPTEATNSGEKSIRKRRSKKEGGDGSEGIIETRKSRAKKPAEPRKNPLDINDLDLHLAGLEQSGKDPTRKDIDAYNPGTHPANENSAAYADAYHALVDKLCRSFSRSQLHNYLKECEMHPTNSMIKMDIAETIIESQWRWPSLKEIQKRHRDRTEVEQRTFEINAIQLFLLLGQDGVELLNMSTRYNVHIALQRDPVSLQVEGIRGSLAAMSKEISAVKQSILTIEVKVPGAKAIKNELVQPISRLANAFVDTKLGNGIVRIHATHTDNLELARRLIVRATSVSQKALRTPLLSYLPSGVASKTSLPLALFPQNYSLYPFLSPRPLPWTMKSGGAFRIRRVVEWIGADGHEDVRVTGGLAGGRGRVLNTSEKPLDLKEHLLAQLTPLPNHQTSSRVVTASLGHILLPSATNSQRADISPPFKGFWPFVKILRWIESSRAETTFVSSLPIHVMNTSPKQQTFLVRLKYHVLPSKPGSQLIAPGSVPTQVMRFEALLDQQAGTPDGSHEEQSESWSRDAETFIDNSELDKSVDVIQGYNVIAEENVAMDAKTSIEQERLQSVSSEDNLENLEGLEDEGRMQNSTPLNTQHSRCWVGTETSVNLILPDRPMDVRFTAFQSTVVPRKQEPEALRDYEIALQSFIQSENLKTPSPPSSFVFNGDTYILDKGCSVRRGEESIPDYNTSSSTRSSGTSTNVISESVLDLETKQKSASCEVLCEDPSSASSWQAFLDSCDSLSSVWYDVGKDNSKAGDLDSDID